MALTRRKLMQGAAVAATVSAVPMKLAFGRSAAFTFKLNTHLQNFFAANEMVFNTAATEPFRKTLRSKGHDADWRGRSGDEAWAVPERYVVQAGLMEAP